MEERKSAPTKSGRTLRVLMQNRSTTFTNRGGDTVVMEKLLPRLKKLGVEVTVDTEATQDPSKFDLVHIFNFAIPDMVKVLGERAKQAGVPFVVTTLYEDVPSFHTQSHFQARVLEEYVRRGQDRAWLESALAEAGKIPPCDRFDNTWAVNNAAALYTNGKNESKTILRDYNGRGTICEVKLGYDLGLPGDPDAFFKEYGVRDFIFCVGRFESRKNQLMLLKALEAEDIPLVFAGGGFTYQPEYARAVTEFRRKGRTIVLPRLSDQMLANAYAAARVHALPSWYELPGLVSLEAGYYGCNVVVTDRGTSRDYMGEMAFYCDPASDESIRNAVLSSYYSPKREGLKEIVMAHDWDKTAQQTLDSYRDITGWRPAEMPAGIPAAVAAAPVQPVSVAPAPTPVTVYDMSIGTTEFQELLEKGELAARNKELDVAQEFLGKAEKLDPNSSRLLRTRGAVYLAESNFMTAHSYFTRALSFDASDPKALCGLGMCEMMKNNQSAAYDQFVRALAIQPNQPVAILQLIECSYMLGRFDDLERALRAFLRETPDDIEMQFCLGGCLYKMGQEEEAETIAKGVLSKNPVHPGAKQLIELCEKARGEKKSTASITSSVEVVREQTTPAAPIEMQPFNSIDQKLMEIEDEKRRSKYDVVRREVEDILRMPGLRADQKETAKCLRAEVLVLTGQISMAEEIYDEILEANPTSARGLCGRGAITASRGDWNGAQHYFEESLRVKPEFDIALSGLGLCAAHARNHEQAWTYYQRALRSNFENVRALLGVVEMGYVLKRLPDVEGHIREYLDLHPADLDFVYSLAGCYFAQGKLQEAAEAIDRITLFDPAHKNALELRSMISNKQSAGYVG